MTKQEARKILISEAIYFRNIGLNSIEFKSALEYDEWRLSGYHVYDAYQLIKEELGHIIAWVWSPIR